MTTRDDMNRERRHKLVQGAAKAFAETTEPEQTKQPEPDTSDIPEANKEWFDKAKLVLPAPMFFCIKPTDKLATAAIRAWIGEAYMEGVNVDKIANAVEHYNKIMAWQAANPDKVKVPD